MSHYCVGWCDGCSAVVTLQQRHKVFRCCCWDFHVLIYLLSYSYSWIFLCPSETTIAFRWTTSCCRMCVMRRQWLHWRTPRTWFISRWPSLDRCISMTCMPLRTTQAVRIYRSLQVVAWNLSSLAVNIQMFDGCWLHLLIIKTAVLAVSVGSLQR